MIGSELFVTGIILIAIGFMTFIIGTISNFTPIGEPSKKDYSSVIGLILVILGFVILTPGAIMMEEETNQEMNDICESIEMKFMKKSNGGLFGNSYVICYDEINKEIKEIPL